MVDASMPIMDQIASIGGDSDKIIDKFCMFLFVRTTFSFNECKEQFRALSEGKTVSPSIKQAWQSFVKAIINVK